MKFSQKKKAKMRKIRLRRIRKTYGYMVGSLISENFRVVDQARIYDVIYLLADNGRDYAVYQISDINNFVKLSSKRLMRLRKYLSNCHNWLYHSNIPINSNGELVQSAIKGKYLLRKPSIS